jgi:hypothetical protein
MGEEILHCRRRRSAGRVTTRKFWTFCEVPESWIKPTARWLRASIDQLGEDRRHHVLPRPSSEPRGVCFDCQLGGLDLQALLAKLLHYGFIQNIGIEFAGFCKFDNSLGDQLIGTIAAVCKSKS